MSSTSPSRPRRARVVDASAQATNHASVSALDSHLGYWMRVVSNQVSHAFKLAVEAHGVTVAEWVVLRALYEQDGVRPSDIAATLGLTRGAISKLVDRLVAKSLVSVRGDAGDARVQVVRLRAAGRHLVPMLAALADENDARAFGHLDQAERAVLLSMLQRVAAQLGVQGVALA